MRQSGEMATRLREANHLGFDQFASVAHIGRCLQPFIGRRALKSPTRPSPDKAARSYGINAPLLLVRSLLYLDLFPATTTAIATQVGSIWIFQFESRLWSDGGLDFAPSTMADHPLGCVRSGATSRYSSHATLQRSTRDFKSLAFYFVYSDIKYLIHNNDKNLLVFPHQGWIISRVSRILIILYLRILITSDLYLHDCVRNVVVHFPYLYLYFPDLYLYLHDFVWNVDCAFPRFHLLWRGFISLGADLLERLAPRPDFLAILGPRYICNGCL